VSYGIAGQVFHAPIINAVPGLKLTVIATPDSSHFALAKRALSGRKHLVVDKEWKLNKFDIW
jgi:hypothetical protein